MADEQKYTFSSLISALLECEVKLSKFYNTLASQTERQDHRSHFTTLSMRSQERKSTIERIRRETIVELALEPISGINLSSLLTSLDSISPNSHGNYLQRAEAVESLAQQAYTQASAAVTSISAEMSELLGRLALESHTRREALKQLESAGTT